MTRVAPLALLLACDPMAPGAVGTVSLDDSIDATDFAWLHLVAHSDEDGEFAVDDLVLDPNQDIGEIRASRYSLDDTVFPYDYDLGGGIGATSVQSWRVTAWLSISESSEHPVAGDPWGSTPFLVGSCGHFDYCGATLGVDVAIDAPFE